MSTPWITSFTTTSVRSDTGLWGGGRFVVGATALSVTDLGFYVITAGGSHDVRINKVSDSSEVARVTINTAGAPAGAYKYGAITPVTLLAGAQYYITAEENNGDGWYDYTSSPVTTADATNEGSVYATVGAPTTFNFGGANAAQMYGVPNFKYDLVSGAAPVKDVWGAMPL